MCLPASAAGPLREKQQSAKFRQIDDAYDADDCAKVLRLGQPIVHRADKRALGSKLGARAVELVVQCERVSGATGQAHVDAVMGSSLKNSSDALWRVRFLLELQGKMDEAAVATLTEMSQGRGSALNSIPLRWVGELLRNLRDNHQDALRERALILLTRDQYLPDEAYGTFDGFHLDLARLRTTSGRPDEARSLLADLVSPGAIASARLDPRLRPLMVGAPDERVAAEQQLAQFRRAIRDHPDQLSALVQASAVLRMLGRPQEAIDLLQSVADQVDDSTAFVDRDSKLNWWWDELARSYKSLNQYEKAASAYRSGAAVGENGALNFSQMINLADLQILFGRPKEALQTLTVFDDLNRSGSPYGLMMLHSSRGCAFASLGEREQLAKEVDYIRAHEKDAPAAVTDIALCGGDDEAAAASLIKRLADPDQRVGALLALSDYADPPVKRPPTAYGSTYLRVVERADVKAAIAAAGGTRRFAVLEFDS